MMLHLIAMLFGSAIGAIPHFVFADRMSFFTDFMVSSVLSGTGYLFALYQLKKMRGDF